MSHNATPRLRAVLLTGLFLLLYTTIVSAQQRVQGTVLDKDTGEPLVGAAVAIPGTTTGTVTDIDGNFTLNVEALPVELQVSYLGYVSQSVSARTSMVGRVLLPSDSKTLDDVVVTQSIAVDRKTPVALSSIDPVIIDEKLGNQEFPEVLKSTPGVYATKAGGGFGDSKINMRGFQAANVAVMVNGIPMNDMGWGGVYWSNWAGLSDVTRSMQTQRGLGASKVSSPSVGGSINIVTKGLEAKQGGTVSIAFGNDGYKKIVASFSTGMNDKGWAVTGLLAKNWGSYQPQGTEYDAYNWFVNIAKRLNDRHQISLTAFGAPQWHNQRSNYDGLTIVGWQKVKDYMKSGSEYNYNPTFGYGKGGERKNANYNKYHKPQIALNHQFQISSTQSLSSVVYCSLGRGFGNKGLGSNSTYANKWYGASNGTLNMDFRKADGTFAYDEIQELNEQSDHGSDMAMSVSTNDHTWIGLLSSYNNEINDNFTVSGGVDFRYYKGVHTNKLTDLYNGDYFVDYYRKNVKASLNSAAADPEFAGQKLHTGDVVYRDYDGYTVQVGLFAQVEYTVRNINVFVAGSVSNTDYWRYDRFYYDKDHAKSDKVNFWGGTIKGGANFNLGAYNNVFFNAGFISRAPFFSGGAFLSSTVSNETNPDAVNEKIASVEVGYGFKNPIFKANLNLYYTKWMNKTNSKRGDLTLKDGTADTWYFNLEGLDARHMGIEVEAKVMPTKWFEASAMFSIGNWVWDCNPVGYFYNSAGEPIKGSTGELASGSKADDHARMELKLDKVKVGGSAQTTAAVGIKFVPMKGLRVGGDWNLFARNYADWSFSSSDITFNGVKEYESPWRIPSGNTIDLSAGYSLKILDKVGVAFSGKVNNLLGAEYICDAVDGADHDWKTAYRVFYGFGRSYSVGMKVTF